MMCSASAGTRSTHAKKVQYVLEVTVDGRQYELQKGWGALYEFGNKLDRVAWPGSHDRKGPKLLWGMNREKGIAKKRTSAGYDGASDDRCCS